MKYKNKPTAKGVGTSYGSSIDPQHLTDILSFQKLKPVPCMTARGSKKDT
jgi:hypothetical protein